MATSKQEKMQNWAKQNKLDNSILESLINKYGEDEAYRLMRDALLRPYELAPTLEGYNNKKISSVSLLQHLAQAEANNSAEREPPENQVATAEINKKNVNETKNSRIDREHIKYTMKNDALTARIILKNGKFTSQIQQEIVGELTPIYGPEISEKIYNMALTNPTNLYVSLDKKPNAQTSRAILQHVLTLEDPKDIENVINATRTARVVSSDRFTKRPSNTSQNNPSAQQPRGKSSSNGYTVGNYTSKMPRALAVGCEKLILKHENNTAKHYLCANGYLTNIGVTHRYHKTEFEDTFGKETTELLLKAEKAARSKGTMYSTDGGKTWQPMPRSGGSKFLLGGLQREIKAGKSCLIKSKKEGDVIELKRIENAGFEIVKVNGKQIPHPSDMTKSRELNMRVLDANYNTIKSTCGSNWKLFSIEEQAALVYSHFHQPRATQLAYTQRQSNIFRLPTNECVSMA